jgi:hypothetical protein
MRCIKSAVENFIEPRLLKKGSGLVLGMVFRAAPFDTEQTSYKRIEAYRFPAAHVVEALHEMLGDGIAWSRLSQLRMPPKAGLRSADSDSQHCAFPEPLTIGVGSLFR